MCFSAEVSFAAAALLTIVGVASLRVAKEKRFYFFAAIPFLFALQQLCEGILWLTIPAGEYPTEISSYALYGYLMFAFLFWPIWIPLSLAAAENKGPRRDALLILLGGGIIWTCIYAIAALGQSLPVSITHHHINYGDITHSNQIIYAILVVVPSFISSRQLTWVFGITVGIAAVISEIFFQQTYTSVWCFFAAILSLMILLIIKKWK